MQTQSVRGNHKSSTLLHLSRDHCLPAISSQALSPSPKPLTERDSEQPPGKPRAAGAAVTGQQLEHTILDVRSRDGRCIECATKAKVNRFLPPWVPSGILWNSVGTMSPASLSITKRKLCLLSVTVGSDANRLYPRAAGRIRSKAPGRMRGK